MTSKRPKPLECPICTSREVTRRGWPGWGIKILDSKANGAKKERTLKPKPQVKRYRCHQCGHKWNTV